MLAFLILAALFGFYGVASSLWYHAPIIRHKQIVLDLFVVGLLCTLVGYENEREVRHIAAKAQEASLQELIESAITAPREVEVSSTHATELVIQFDSARHGTERRRINFERPDHLRIIMTSSGTFVVFGLPFVGICIIVRSRRRESLRRSCLRDIES